MRGDIRLSQWSLSMVGLDRGCGKIVSGDKKWGARGRSSIVGQAWSLPGCCCVVAGEEASRRMIVTIYSKKVIKVAVARDGRVSGAKTASADAGPEATRDTSKSDSNLRLSNAGSIHGIYGYLGGGSPHHSLSPSPCSVTSSWSIRRKAFSTCFSQLLNATTAHSMMPTR